MIKPLLRGRPRLLALPCLLIATGSASASAEWYFRGTPSGWSAESLTHISGNEYRTCQSFASGDGSGGPRFKIDRYGDWSENYPTADYSVAGERSYEITFYSDSHSIAVSEVASCSDDSGFAANFPSLFFRGTPNAWGASALALVADNTWELAIDFDGQADQRYKLDLYGDWTQNYGDNDGDNLLDAGGGDIYTGVSGSYLLRVNDSDFTYQLIGNGGSSSSSSGGSSSGGSSSGSGGNDSWYFRGTANGWAATEMGSSDGTSFCTEQSFGSGDGGGGPRFKIDHYGDWTESYPSTDYTVSANSDYEICFDSSSHTIAVTQLGTTTPPPVGDGSDFRAETIYFVLTARFYDGDPSNNYYNRDRIMPGDPQWRGDFKGLIQQLDYIKDLGFTAIWVTPPVENRSGLDYHGYHAYDWTKVDPRLESVDATYQDFIDAAHAKGIKVIQDVVVNHSSQYGIRNQVWIDHLPIKYYVPQGSSQGMISNNPYFGNLGDYLSPFRDDNDNPVAPQWFRDRHTSDPDGLVPLIDPKTGVSVPLAGYDPNRFFGIDANNLDPAWYHLDGFMSGGDWENPTALQKKHMAGDTIDLATGNQNVKDYLNGAIEQYLDMGVDAIRVDTVKHVERDELLSYVHEWQAHKPGLFVFGEALVKGLGFGSELGNDNASAVIRPWWYTRTGADPSNPQGDSDFAMIDFPLFSTFRDNVTRGSFGGIKGALDMDWTYADPTELVTFFQNHDVGPDNDFKYRFGGAESDAAMTYNLLWTIRGIPTLYYGEEIMFQAGLPQDIQSANDTIDQTGRAYFGPHLDNLAATQNHNLYRHIKRLNQIRHAIPALQKGQMEKVSEWGAGMSFVRNDSAGSSYAVVGLAAGGNQGITVSGIPNGTYTDAVTGAQVQVNNGSISFTVKTYSAGIYVLNGPGKIGSDGAYLR
ncbi:alpha-amylase family glycosyl hydrolase [Microbulbifer pacificus]|uniref:Alpha-amylase family glycosyl hydrolase n=1 Tax=Microbulbifer pacificus TaxID=407164 RepID=A0AAU0MWH6_9GAMM|nr:alpha-amylase family glycosyl hydrolase [Microbulbifer pacificus]WOX04529.1 alpha-amylase family glycosyl hydrolase [Microbulbifer pacificus]